MDKYLYPYYKADLDAGKIDHDSALELMECFFLKLSELDKVASNESTAVNTGPAHGQTITIGGTLADGSDITNDISILVLEADRNVALSPVSYTHLKGGTLLFISPRNFGEDQAGWFRRIGGDGRGEMCIRDSLYSV